MRVDPVMARLGALLGVVLLGVVWMLFAVSADFDKWKAWCGDQGGRIVDSHSTTTGVGYAPGNGKAGSGGVVVTTGTTTTYYCLSESGGVLDIR